MTKKRNKYIIVRDDGDKNTLLGVTSSLKKAKKATTETVKSIISQYEISDKELDTTKDVITIHVNTEKTITIKRMKFVEDTININK